MILSLLTDVLLVIGGASAIYCMLSGKPKQRRATAQKISTLAIAGALLIEAHTRSGWSHWMNLGIGVFCIVCVVGQIAWDRRRNVL